VVVGGRLGRGGRATSDGGGAATGACAGAAAGSGAGSGAGASACGGGAGCGTGSATIGARTCSRVIGSGRGTSATANAGPRDRTGRAGLERGRDSFSAPPAKK